MPAIQRVTIEQIIDAYKATGSVWKAAKSLGVVGQSVHERLKAVDYPMVSRTWTSDELEELRGLAETMTISQIAIALGRPYYGIAIKMSRLGLANRYGNRMKRTLPRGSGMTKEKVKKLVAHLRGHNGSLRTFAKMHGIQLESLVMAIQKYDLEFWRSYAKASTDLVEKTCPYCEAVFHPMTGKQKTCSRKCTADMKRDETYFGGKRRNTIGLAEGICQLCLQPKTKGLSSHHILGKKNDPENDMLIALCPGCHQLVGQLAGRKFADTCEGWENLITLVMGRRLAEKEREYAGVYACVELEYLTMEDIEECPQYVESWGAK